MRLLAVSRFPTPLICKRGIERKSCSLLAKNNAESPRRREKPKNLCVSPGVILTLNVIYSPGVLFYAHFAALC